MALTTDVQNRIGAARLAELTNPDGSTSGIVNRNILGFACTDAEAEFEEYSGILFDDTLAMHVAWGIDAVVLKLQLFKGLPDDSLATRADTLRNRARDLGRAERPGPSTTGEYDIETARLRGENRRTFFTPSFWDGYRGGSKSSGTEPAE